MDVRLDLAGNVELVAVQGDPAQVSEEVRLGGWGWTPLSYLPGQHVELLTGLADE